MRDALIDIRSFLPAVCGITRGIREPMASQTSPTRRSHSNFIAAELNGLPHARRQTRWPHRLGRS